MKKHLWIWIPVGILALILLAVIALVVYLTITEYKPADRQAAERAHVSSAASAVGSELTIYTWNIGYAGLDAQADFFMDGGKTVNPSSASVAENLAAIAAFIAENPADAWLLQEVDVDSNRTGHVNELEAVAEAFSGSYALAYNYKCAFVPIPVPAIGKVTSGIATLTSGRVTSTPERIALPCPFLWPTSTANLKRCLLVTRLAVEGSERELVLVNLHLEAYDDGEGKAAQTKMLMDFLQSEYEKGNYVVAGGDFNQTFPNVLDQFAINGDVWTPSVMEQDALPQGFCYAYDVQTPSCRLLDRPLDADSQMYVLDGFIVSPNVQIEAVQTVDLGFANSDHNPVKLQLRLLDE